MQPSNPEQAAPDPPLPQRPEYPRPNGAPWPRPLCWLFRFVFIYFVVYNIPQPLSELPFAAPLLEWYDRGWRVIVPWVGEHVLRLPEKITIFPGGSGDTTYNYVQLLCFLAIAVAGTSAWGLIRTLRRDPKGRHGAGYDRLHRWFLFYLRLVLGVSLLSYGFAKVIKLQFPDPDVGRLVQPYGESSPMGLLWTFMGASTPYTFFAGLSEVVPGLLLMFRRTALVGALGAAAVMLNVVLLNFCYDVPVKLYSSHLFLMACVIAAPDMGRLFRVAVLNRHAEPGPERRLFETRWLDLTGTAVKAVLVAALVSMLLISALMQRTESRDTSAVPPVVGTYAVESFTERGVDRPLLVTDATVWRRVGLNRWGIFSVRTMGGAATRYTMEVDEKAGVLKLTPWRGGSPLPEGAPPPEPEIVTFTLSEGRLTLEGTVGTVPVRVTAKRIEAADFLLMNRGFHWINEQPFNR